MSLTSLYWFSVSVLAHFTNDMASVRVWLSKSLSLLRSSRHDGGVQDDRKRCIDVEMKSMRVKDGRNKGKEGKQKGKEDVNISEPPFYQKP